MGQQRQRRLLLSSLVKHRVTTATIGPEKSLHLVKKPTPILTTTKPNCLLKRSLVRCSLGCLTSGPGYFRSLRNTGKTVSACFDGSSTSLQV
jgi:hypothetical protein